jgi:hypothetical protein
MARLTTQKMKDALALVESGTNPYRAALTAGVKPSSLYAKIAKIRRKSEAQQEQQPQQQ